MKRNFFKVLLVMLVCLLCLSFTPLLFGQDSSTSGQGNSNTVAGYQFTAADSWLLVEPAVCYITSIYYAYVYDPNKAAWSGQYYYGPFGGTGFCVNPETGTIVTAGHMVDEAQANFVNLKWAILDEYIKNEYPDYYDTLTNAEWNQIYDTYKVAGSTSDTAPDREVWVQFNTAVANVPENPGNTFTKAEVLQLSDRTQRDIAILRITPVTGRALSSAIIGDSSMVEVGDALTIIGYPWTSDIGQNNPLDPTVTQGTVSGRVMYQGNEVLQVQGDARPGNSGGPVLGKDGTIIGILTMGTDNTNNYLRPSNDVKSLLGVENKLGQVDQEWRLGLAMYRQSHFTEAIKHFDAVLNLSAGHKLAQEYKAKAQQNMGQDKPLVAETTAPVATIAAETTVLTTTQESINKVAQKVGTGIGITIIILAIVLPIIIVIIIVVVVVLLVRRKNKPQAPPTVAYQAPSQIQQTEEKPEQKGKFCPNCGSPTQEGAAFCPNCGNKLK
ncbi:MAG: trypsin-like peptidase domain-containing protein [Actinobacteria bacterium]|nr:trypsin-like peptidase domain-containing protein [Actinomycetota bacterium]